ncbi:hypothetical protein NHQ30_008405 [Ciborinia camelliae]|nr:hypothetical protein NHQ30_008405 [Ciborinia camelliae]
MAHQRIEAMLNDMEAPKLRELLKTLCQRGKFAVEDAMGKIEVDGRNIVIGNEFVDLTRSDDGDESDEEKDSEEDEEEEEEEEEDEDDVPALSKQQIRQLISSKKRNFNIFECENCKEDFDIENNTKVDCWYHPGEKEVDDESRIWADHDYRVHGEPDRHENDPTFADGFEWTCCENSGDAKGCKNTRHKVMEEGSRKRPRY